MCKPHHPINKKAESSQGEWGILGNGYVVVILVIQYICGFNWKQKREIKSAFWTSFE